MFNLSFLNSGILLAALATIIPLLIYLFAKKRPKRIIFSSIKFIKLSQKQQKKKINLINIILLIIRMLIILLIVLAIARPSIKSPLLKSGKMHPATAVAVIIDNSPSMDYLIDTRTSLDKAKLLCNDLNNILSDNDITILLTLDKSWNDLQGTINFGKIDPTLINNISVTNLPIPSTDVIKTAEEMLAESQLVNKELYFITDGQLQKLPETFSHPTYYIIPDTIETWNNISCSNVTLSRDFVNKQMNQRLTFQLQNHSNVDQEDVLYRIVIDDNTEAEKITDLSANQSKELSFLLDIQAEGWQSGYVEVQNERYIPDNRSYFSFYQEENPRIGIITGIDKLPLTLSIILELYSGSKANLDLLNPNELNFEQMNQYDFLIIYKAEALNQRITFLIDSFQQQEKGILFIADEALSGDWIGWLEDNFSVNFNQFNNSNQSETSNINRYHPITSMLADQTGLSVRDFWEIEAKSNVLMTTEDHPIIVEKEHSFLWTFDPASLKNPFLVESAFPVVLYNTLLYLSKEGLDIEEHNVGDLFITRGETLRLPGGNSISSNRNRYLFQQPGLYEINDTIIPVNMRLDESDFKPFTDETQKNLTFCGKDWDAKILQSRYGFEMWKYLLALVLILFAVEMIIVKREEKKKR